MKKLLLCVCCGVFGLFGCSDNKTMDFVTTCYYVYANRSSSEITLSYFEPNSNPEGYEEGNGYTENTFTIPVNKSQTLIFERMVSANPFGANGMWGNLYRYVTVSNGEKTITQREEDGDELFLNKSYVESSYEDYNITYVYVFTDDFFADGEPVEPAATVDMIFDHPLMQ